MRANAGADLKVLHVIPAVAPRYGGPSRAVIEMCLALQARGVEPLVVTTDADGDQRLAVELERAVVFRGAPAIFFRRQWSESFKYSRALARWLERRVADFQVVHIHGVFSHACLAAAARCRRDGVPYVVRPLGTLDPWSLGQKALRKQVLWHLAARRMLRAAAAIHYTTDAERRGAERALGLGRGIVIPLGADDHLLASAPPQHSDDSRPGADLYVLALARLHPKKGMERFVDVFLEVARREGLERWRLVIAGDGDRGYVNDLKRRVRERDAGKRVVFTGWLDGEERAAALRGAQLLVLPSHQENFSLAVVEALACGVPVLVSEHVNLAVDVEAARAGWVVPLEPADLGQRLEEVLRSGEERARRGQAGRALAARRFRWTDIAAELHALYASLARPAAPCDRAAT